MFVGLLFFAMGAATLAPAAIGIVATFIIDDLDMSRATLGWVVSTNVLIAAALSPIAGALTDRFGGKASIIAVFVSSALAFALFGIASGTKGFTALAIGVLVDQGVISLVTTMAEIDPAYCGFVDPHATVRHLLTQTSGIFDYYDDALNTIAREGLAVYGWRVSRPYLAVARGHFDRDRLTYTERLMRRLGRRDTQPDAEES